MTNRFHDQQDKPKKPGLVARERELAELQEASAAGSVQAKFRLQRARSAVARQRNVAEGVPALTPRKKGR